ncbi:hypothetical protein DKX38_026063 [Salix brachista]|uniref:25S rRNA (uridine-N(3))-methyltransferase BMT5-like domain-containing protein n=1 Tax=Salix brachista TaxID=2182728 RepID=A0A5N5JUD0_9ROSI|nr:hypothetical protein DKX38_026063 [Salix brachista]
MPDGNDKQLEMVGADMVGTEGQLENMAGAESQLEISKQIQMETLKPLGLLLAWFATSLDSKECVTHKTAHPFDRWEIQKLAEDAGLCLIAKSEFFTWFVFESYSNSCSCMHHLEVLGSSSLMFSGCNG